MRRIKFIPGTSTTYNTMTEELHVGNMYLFIALHNSGYINWWVIEKINKINKKEVVFKYHDYEGREKEQDLDIESYRKYNTMLTGFQLTEGEYGVCLLKPEYEFLKSLMENNVDETNPTI